MHLFYFCYYREQVPTSYVLLCGMKCFTIFINVSQVTFAWVINPHLSSLGNERMTASMKIKEKFN